MNLTRLALALLCASILGIAAATTVRWWETRGDAPDRPLAAAISEVREAGTPPTIPIDRAGAAGVVNRWDARRARAWSAGDTAALAALYTPGSAAGRHDVEMLSAWIDRGVRVRDLRVQLIEVDVRARSRERLVLRVTDRVAGGRVTGAGPAVHLPQDRPSQRTLELERPDGEGPWLVVSVR